jgi:hypothetical protein
VMPCHTHSHTRYCGRLEDQAAPAVYLSSRPQDWE